MDVVSRLRMQRAEQMLLTSECKLDQIAEPLGYKTPFAFSRAFKRCFGVSPAHYREGMLSPIGSQCRARRR
jgi:AraC-like DNA-binding protein